MYLSYPYIKYINAIYFIYKYLLDLGKMGFLSCIELGFSIPIMPMLIFGLLSNVCNHHSIEDGEPLLPSKF